jgi:hypothetical protein
MLSTGRDADVHCGVIRKHIRSNVASDSGGLMDTIVPILRPRDGTRKCGRDGDGKGCWH